MRRAFSLIVRTVTGLWSLLMVLLMVASVALSIAMTLLPQVLGAVASVVESVTGRKTAVTEARSQQARMTERLAKADADLAAERTARRTETRALRQQIARMSDEARLAPVTYRGQRVAIREAVHDTSERVSRRAAVAATRNVGSTVGEALPVIGVGVIVAATAWELSDSCQMMQEMRELDAAFNPENPISEDEVCGIKPPTRDEIWTAVKSSPGTAWNGAKSLYADLPEVSISASYDWTLARLSGMSDWIMGSDAPVN
ncbi:hypothetical protein [Paracoccus laeviglucosivorans]|uniref:Uncharacterized protein n=1 Tax=Paracoccus laeviglucosivorans TaxID=1197861 RepID=A0A521DYI9_9RHOB|nr:hypothetical protein [Paracoccus laeviglucosivorans]SMO76682.1 hypothetical protein SAMN06265221_11092 [Paracoccus laeviglucosivorans]